jgi:hypothetical protein
MAHFAHIYGLIAEANMDVMLAHYGITTLVNATYEDKSEKLANVIGTQAKSGAPFHLPDRLDQIDKDLKDIRDKDLKDIRDDLKRFDKDLKDIRDKDLKDIRDDLKRFDKDLKDIRDKDLKDIRDHLKRFDMLFEALFQHFGLPLPTPPPTPPTPPAQPAAPAP